MSAAISRRVGISCLFLCSCCLLAALLSRRVSTWTRFRNGSLIQALAVGVLISSLIHIGSSSTLLFSLGTGYSQEACQAASVLTLSTYLLTKLFVYLFLLERVFLVWHFMTPRRKSLTYRLALVPFLGMLLIFAYTIATRHYDLRMPEQGNTAGSRYDTVCHLGLDKLATALLLGSSSLFSCVLLVLFLIPVARAQFHRARTIARKSVVATVAALCSEAIILGILLGHDGWERAFGWLSSCGADVLLNAVIIYSVTSNTPQSSSFDVEAIGPPPDTAPCSPMCQLSRSPYGSTRSVGRIPTGLPQRPSNHRSHSLDHLGLHKVGPQPPNIALVLDQPLRPRPKVDRGLALDLQYEDDDNSPGSIEYLGELRNSYLSTSSSAESSPSPRPNDKASSTQQH